MGIKGLYPFIKKFSLNSIKKINIADLQNKKIAIDVSMINYEFLTSLFSIRN